MNKRIFLIAVVMGSVAGVLLTTVAFWLWHSVAGDAPMITVLGAAGLAAIVFLICEIRCRRAVNTARRANSHELKKPVAYYRLLASWMTLRNRDRTLAEYFTDHHFTSVAIFGLGRLGMCLLEELRNSNIDIRYGIDRDVAHLSYLDLRVVSPESPIEPVDVIVVTPFYECGKLITELQGKTSSAIITLEDIVGSM
jgi:hypothetical protein